MACGEVDIRQLKNAVVAVLDHMIEDLHLTTVQIDTQADFYWALSPEDRCNTEAKPIEFETGRLSDDISFTKMIHRGDSADVSYNLVHIAPLLRYLGEKIKS